MTIVACEFAPGAATRVKFVCWKMLRLCPWFEIHHANMTEYCQRHGYGYEYDIEPPAYYKGQPLLMSDRSVVWSHITALAQLRDCDIMVQTGGDTVVTNMTKRIEDFIPAAAHVAIVKEVIYECDCIIRRNTPEARSFMEDWIAWMTNRNHPLWMNYGTFVPPFTTVYTRPVFGEHAEWMLDNIGHDGDTLTAICERYPEQAARVHPIGKKDLMVKHVHWEPGDFIMHVPGSSDEQRCEYLKIGLENVVR